MEEEQRAVLAGLYHSHGEKLFRAALRLTGSEETARELVQETFVVAITRWADLSVSPSPEGWLMKTVKFLAMNELRRRRREELAEDLQEVPAPADEAGRFEELLPEGLSQEDRQILIWKYKEQRTQREIADRLGVSLSVSANRISRALGRLRALLKEGPGRGT